MSLNILQMSSFILSKDAHNSDARGHPHCQCIVMLPILNVTQINSIICEISPHYLIHAVCSATPSMMPTSATEKKTQPIMCFSDPRGARLVVLRPPTNQSASLHLIGLERHGMSVRDLSCQSSPRGVER